MSAESLSWYNKINDLWQFHGFPIRFASRSEIAEKVDYNIAKHVWRQAFRKEYPKFKGKLIFVKELTGNRYTTYEKGRYTHGAIKVWINTSKGWSDLVHDLGHCIHYYKCRCFTREKPHNANHATIEWRITKMVFENGYIDKSRKAIEEANAKSKLRKNRVHTNYTKLLKREENLLKRQKQLCSNLKRVENSLKKVSSSIKSYQKKYSEEKLTVEKIKAPERKSVKTYIHPKQKIEILQKEHDWLFVWVDDEPSYDDGMRIYVLEKSSDLYHYDQYLDSDHYFTTWKTAHEEALRLINEVNND